MAIATAGWIGGTVLTMVMAWAWHPLWGLASGVLALALFGGWRWVADQRRLQSSLSHNAVAAALAARDDCALALFDGGRRPGKRVGLIAAQLGPEDLVVPLDRDIAVVLARPGPHDRLLARLCRCQLALQNAGCHGGAIGAIRPQAGDGAATVLSCASQALVQARLRGPFEIEYVNVERATSKAACTTRRAALSSPTDSVSAVLCASTGATMGLRPLPDFGPFAAKTLTQLTGRLAHCAGIARDGAGSIILPVSADLVMSYDTIDALGVVLDATEIAPDRLILCPDEALFPGGQLRDMGVRMATPLLTQEDADLAADGLLWLPAATTRCAARDPGRHTLLSECLSAAGERDIPVLALDISDPDDATLLSQMGVAWIEGSAIRPPVPINARQDAAVQFHPDWTIRNARPASSMNDRTGLPPATSLSFPHRGMTSDPAQRRAGRN